MKNYWLPILMSMLTAVISPFFVFQMAAKDIHVCEDCEYNTISEAIEKARPKDHIWIHEGSYVSENITIDKPLHISGTDRTIIISKSGDEILTVMADSVTIEGLTLQNVKTNYLKELSAIRVKDHGYFKIINNTIENCFFAIYLEHAKNGEITNNTINGDATVESSSGNGIHCWYSKNINISGNKIINHRDGIYLEFVHESNIENNVSYRNKRYGLHFMFSNDNVYTHNTFDDNGVGVAVMFSKNIKMESNVFKNNWGRSSYGLLLKEINDAEIVENTFDNNTIGIFVEGSNRIDYVSNNFSDNGWAVKVSGGCSRNVIRNNNFLDNALDLEINTKINDNEIHHNYWTAYKGYDLDQDGIGDVPHFPVKLFSYIVNMVPESIILLRSFFVEMLNLSEKISPVFTPKEVMDSSPLMKAHTDDSN